MHFLLWPFEQLSPAVLAALFGSIVGLATMWLVRHDLPACGVSAGRWPAGFGVLGATLGGALTWSMLVLHCQQTPEVVPTEFWRAWRVPYHLCLLTLLLSITATDLKTYYILDRTSLVGLAIGLGLATLSGDLQLAHVWVDWNQEIPQLRGPYLPDWLGQHPHLHGLAWSSAGAACGAAITGLVREVSARILAIPALGAGDVWLMAMIGSFLGWQATLVTFLFAPLLALSIGMVLRLATNRAAIPYGPYLAGGAVCVLFGWRWIWMAEYRLVAGDVSDPRQIFAVRRFFGDPVTMGIVLGGAVVLFVVLLTGLRIYRSWSVPPRTPSSTDVSSR